MTTFDNREKAFEAKFQHDQDLQFRVRNRRNRLFGLWAAELLGLTGAEADEYTRSVVLADLEKPGDDDVHDKVLADFNQRGVDVSDHRLRKQLAALMDVARRQIMSEAEGR